MIAPRWALFALLLAAPSARAALPVQPSLIVKKLTIDIAVGADGRAVTTTHRETSPTSRAAAAAIGQFPIAFNPSLEHLDITEAYTGKADGGRIAIDPAAVRTQLAPGIPSAPIFMDVQQKVVVFPALEADDLAVITYRKTTDRALFAGQFFWEAQFDRTTAWDQVDISIEAPATLPLATQSFGVAAEQHEQDGVVRYQWHYRNTEVVAEDPSGVSSWDRLPRIFVSSFHDYAALAAAYAQLAEPKTRVTPALAARAEAITRGITDRHAQAQALYEWVSAHIRYVALYLAAGGVEPHEAGAVLLNGYGDCKDHSVLFEALLRAKGIESRPVLINLGSAYTLSGPPTMAQLDHVITYLPEFDIYADTTSGVAAFGTLPFQEYGKPAVLVEPGEEVAARTRDALFQMPLLDPAVANFIARTDAHVDLDGAIIGHSSIEATGPAAIALRLTARWVQTAGHEAAARRMLVSLAQTGTGIFQFAPPDGFANSFRVTGSFHLDPQPEILEGDSFAMPLGLQLLVRPGDFLLGPLNRPTLPVTEATPCFPGRQTETLNLELPEGRHPLRLPSDRVIDRPEFRYSARWSMQGQIITVIRALDAHPTTAVCSGALRREIADAMIEIRRDQRLRIALSTP